MIISDNKIQGSADWIRDRLGVLTASQVDMLLTPTLKMSSQRNKLMAKLIAERLLGEPVEDFGGTYWTDRGKALESEALAYFSLQTGLDPVACGVVYRDESRDCGCSPDALVLSDYVPVAGVELKCPSATNHMLYLLGGDAKQYAPQVQFSLWVTGLPTWYFMSYYPGLPPLLKTVEPDPEYQDAFLQTVPLFLDEMRSQLETLKQ